MSTAAEATDGALSTKRHPTLVRVCAWLEAIIHGREADRLLNDPTALSGATGIALLPAWQWAEPLIEVGRKDRAYDGSSLLLPVRNTWTDGPVALLSGESLTASYRFAGLGHTGAGQARIIQHQTGGFKVSAGESMPSLGTPLFVGTGTQRQIRSALEAVRTAGNDAQWEMMVTFVEPWVRMLSQRAHSAVSYEIAGAADDFRPVLDEQGIESVVNTLMLGDEDRRGNWRPGAVHRMIDLCLKPDCFLRVEPLRYMDKHLRREAEAVIRRQLGDPHIGPKVRKVARAHPRANVHEIVELYRQAYPNDCLSEDRACDALSAGPDVMAGVTGLAMISESGETSVYEEVA